MAGFMKISFVAEHFQNYVVNVLHYRAADWLPLQGNPFADTLAALDAVLTHMQAEYLGCHNQDTRLLRVEAVGYADNYTIVTPSPLIRTVNLPGTRTMNDTVGSFLSCNIGLRCGEQHQINELVKSKRNRGYLSVGPTPKGDVEDDGALGLGYLTSVEHWAEKLDDEIVMVVPAVTLTPIRIHTIYTRPPFPKMLAGRTYSDILGYTLPRNASARRSRMSEVK